MSEALHDNECRIYLAEPDGFSPTALSLLRAYAEVEVGRVERSDLTSVLERVDAFWFRLGHRFDEAIWPEHPRCRVLATPVTGLDHIDLAACEKRGVKVVSLRGETEFLKEVRATAELTVGLLLALIRHIPRAAAHVEAGGWNRDLFRGQELYGKKAGILGFGRLGAIVAEYLRAFGMEVAAYDPHWSASSGVSRAASLRELFETSDVVSIHVSYDRTTHHLVDADLLGRAKAGLILVNTARGAVVDSAALVEALEAGRIGAAALDVVEGEPEVSSNPLLHYAARHSNLLIVPHIGGNTRESFEKTEIFLAKRVLSSLGVLPAT